MPVREFTYSERDLEIRQMGLEAIVILEVLALSEPDSSVHSFMPQLEQLSLYLLNDGISDESCSFFVNLDQSALNDLFKQSPHLACEYIASLAQFYIFKYLRITARMHDTQRQYAEINLQQQLKILTASLVNDRLLGGDELDGVRDTLFNR